MNRVSFKFPIAALAFSCCVLFIFGGARKLAYESYLNKKASSLGFDPDRRSEKESREVLAPWAERLFKGALPNRDNRALLAQKVVSHYRLEIAERELRAIRQEAERIWIGGNSMSWFHAYDQSWLHDLKRSWHRARFVFKDQIYEVKLKLRGYESLHYEYNHLSFRVRFRRGERFEGKREINLVVNYDKGFFLSHIINEDLKRNGALTNPGKYVTLSVNGDLWGVYLSFGNWRVEEYELQDRGEGAIVRGNGRIESGDDIYQAAAASVLRQLKDLSPNEDRARNLVDVEQVARLLAWCTLANNRHASVVHNVVYYFDPGRGRITPIFFDPGRVLKIEKAILGHQLDFGEEFSVLDRVSAVRNRKNQILYELVTKKWKSIQDRFIQLDKKYSSVLKEDRFRFVHDPRGYQERYHDQTRNLSYNRGVIREALEKTELVIDNGRLLNTALSDVLITSIESRNFDPPHSDSREKAK